MAIIDVLEMVEINDGDGKRTAGPVRPPDFLVQFIKDTTAIERARQFVGVGEFGNSGIGFLELVPALQLFAQRAPV